MRLLLLLLPFLLIALPAQKLPLDAISGKIYFAEEVLVKDAPHTDLYNRAKAWIKRTENENANLVKDDLANGVLVFNSFFTLTTQHEKKAATIIIRYTMQLELADDKYWYSVYDFKWQELPKTGKLKAGEKLPFNKPLETILYSKNEQAPEKEFYKLLESSVHQHITARINSLKESML